jgi:hypothetical protein
VVLVELLCGFAGFDLLAQCGDLGFGCEHACDIVAGRCCTLAGLGGLDAGYECHLSAPVKWLRYE